MIDTRTLTTIQLADRWVSIPDALTRSSLYQEMADQLRRQVDVETCNLQNKPSHRAKHLRAEAHRFDAIADELRTAARRAELATIDGRLSA